MSRVDKSKMPCNKPRASTKANKRKWLKLVKVVEKD